MKLRWTQRARRDLVAIGRHISRDKPGAARAWVERIREVARQAARMPRSGRVLPELGQEDVREVILRNYRIVYRVQKGAIDILTVFEGHRLFQADESPSAEA